jgi:hypothetical protein
VAAEEDVMSEQVEVVPDRGAQRGDGSIEEPGKLLRIAVMLRELQEEVRRAPTDEVGRERLREVYSRAIQQLSEALSEDLRDELSSLTLPLSEGTPSESEILIAQAQLIGWLEGLFQGIQAAIVNQQLQARQQLEQMRSRGLPGGRVIPGGAGGPSGPGGQQQEGQRPPSGQYL